MGATRPSANYWQDGEAGGTPFLPGMNNRETAIMDYAEDLVATADVDTSKSAGWTLAKADIGKTFLVNNGSAATVTIPTSASVGGWVVGEMVTIVRWNTGTLAVDDASGVTLHTNEGYRSLRVQYSAIVLLYVGSDVWWGQGDLTT